MATQLAQERSHVDLTGVFAHQHHAVRMMAHFDVDR
jgi:hypothetical protein